MKLYQSGLGLRTISARLRTPKTSVRRWLVEAGVYDAGKAQSHYAEFRKRTYAHDAKQS